MKRVETANETSLLRKNILSFYLFKGLSGFFFITPVLVLFWQENNLNFTEIMVLQSLFAIAVVILEVPSGYFADIFGRKNTLLFSSVFFLAGGIIYTLAKGFFTFLAAEICFAFAMSFASGADSAFVYDTLLAEGREKSYARVWGKGYGIFLIVLAVSTSLGGLMAKINLRFPLIAMVPFMVLRVIVSLLMEEPPRQKTLMKANYFRQLADIVKGPLLQNRELLFFMIFSAIIYSLNQVVLWFYQPYFSLSGLKLWSYGLIFSSFNIIAALASRNVSSLEKRFGERKLLLLLPILVVGSYFLMAHIILPLSFLFCYMQQVVRGIQGILISHRINRMTGSDIRATVLSFQSLFSRLLYAAIIPGIGWIADTRTIPAALSVTGVIALLLLVPLTFYMIRKKYL